MEKKNKNNIKNFESVIGVDTFVSDVHTQNKEDHFERTKIELDNFKNIIIKYKNIRKILNRV